MIYSWTRVFFLPSDSDGWINSDYIQYWSLNETALVWIFKIELSVFELNLLKLNLTSKDKIGSLTKRYALNWEIKMLKAFKVFYLKHFQILNKKSQSNYLI